MTTSTQQNYDVFIVECGTIKANDGTGVTLWVHASINMELPFLPFPGLLVRPPSPDDNECNDDFVFSEILWDGDNGEFCLEVKFDDPRDEGHDDMDDDYTLLDWVKYRRRLGWTVNVERWSFPEGGSMSIVRDPLYAP